MTVLLCYRRWKSFEYELSLVHKHWKEMQRAVLWSILIFFSFWVKCCVWNRRFAVLIFCFFILCCGDFIFFLHHRIKGKCHWLLALLFSVHIFTLESERGWSEFLYWRGSTRCFMCQFFYFAFFFLNFL